MLNALNEVLRDDFIKDSMAGVGRWNKVLEKNGIAFRLQVPHKAFNRRIGTLAGIRVSPEGMVLSEDQWRSEEHTSELQSLMRISYAVFCLKKKNNKLKKTL